MKKSNITDIIIQIIAPLVAFIMGCLFSDTIGFTKWMTFFLGVLCIVGPAIYSIRKIKIIDGGEF